MKRGIVMEVKRKKAVILTENGRFERIRLPKGKTAEIGDTVSIAGQGVGYVGKKRSNRWLPAISTLSVILIFVVLLGGFGPIHPHRAVAAYVSYDVNPSFSVAVNGQMQVVSVKTWNQDAANLFAGWNSYHLMALKDFSHLVVQKVAQQGYFGAQPRILIATAVVAKDDKEREKVKSSLQNEIENIRSDPVLMKDHVTVSVKSGDSKTRQKANSYGLSLGKYLLYLDAANSNKHLSIPSIKKMSVSKIEQEIKKKANPADSTKKNTKPVEKNKKPVLAQKSNHPDKNTKTSTTKQEQSIPKQQTTTANSRTSQENHLQKTASVVHKTGKATAAAPKINPKKQTKSGSSKVKSGKEHHNKSNPDRPKYMKRPYRINKHQNGQKHHKMGQEDHNKNGTPPDRPTPNENRPKHKQDKPKKARHNHLRARLNLQVSRLLHGQIVKKGTGLLHILSESDKKTDSHR